MKSMVLPILVALQAATVHAQQPLPPIGSVVDVAPQTPAARPASLLGQSLDDFRASDFYKFFGLAPIGEEPGSPSGLFAKATTFGTTGRFKDSIWVMVGTDAAGRITFAGLTLRRDFVDDPKTSRFARDVAKSFLVISPGFSSKEVAGLAEDIWNACDPKSPQFAVDASGKLAQKPCAAPSPPSQAYEVYLGKRDALGIAFEGSMVKLSNRTEPGQPAALLIMFGPAPKR